MKLNFLILAFLLLTINNCIAFRPVAHIILKDKIVERLPEGNRFKKAMIDYPKIASWGAVGPDLGYNVDYEKKGFGFMRRMKNSGQIAEMAHYHCVGTFTTNLVNKAKEVDDDKFYAFVGGWITHIAGDFGSHGILVKPEAGYYISYEDGRVLHGDLEKMADTYLFSLHSNRYGLSIKDFHYNFYWEYFFGTVAEPRNRSEKCANISVLDCMIGGNVQKWFIEVYKDTYQLDTVKFDLIKLAATYYRAVGGGSGEFVGFKQFSLPDIIKELEKNNRARNINDAFDMADSLGYDYILRASSDKFEFSNSWNLDVGENGAPTYVIAIEADKGKTAKTRGDLSLTFVGKNEKLSSPVSITPKLKIWKHAYYDGEKYFYAVYMGGKMGDIDCWKIENVKAATLSIGRRYKISFINRFRIKNVYLYYNGDEISSFNSPMGDKAYSLRKSSPISFKIDHQVR